MAMLVSPGRTGGTNNGSSAATEGLRKLRCCLAWRVLVCVRKYQTMMPECLGAGLGLAVKQSISPRERDPR